MTWTYGKNEWWKNGYKRVYGGSGVVSVVADLSFVFNSFEILGFISFVSYDRTVWKIVFVRLWTLPYGRRFRF